MVECLEQLSFMIFVWEGVSQSLELGHKNNITPVLSHSSNYYDPYHSLLVYGTNLMLKKTVILMSSEKDFHKLICKMFSYSFIFRVYKHIWGLKTFVYMHR